MMAVMDRRRADNAQPLSDIADTIEIIAGDDEITSKIILKFIKSLNIALSNGGPFDSFVDPSVIVTNFWPYGPPPDITITATPEPQEHHVSKRRSLKEDAFPILNKMQQEMGRKLLQQDLTSIAKSISIDLGIPLKKRTRQSKSRILEWISVNWDLIEPILVTAVHNYKNLLNE